MIPCNERCWGTLIIKIENKNRSNETTTKKNPSDWKKLCLSIKFTENYPIIPPNLYLFYKNFEEYQDDDLNLQKMINQKAKMLANKMKTAMLFEIILTLREEYHRLKEIKTFYENMENEQEETQSSIKINFRFYFIVFQ